MAKDDAFYKKYPNQDIFIEVKWSLFLAAARATLARMLATPIDDAQKALIHEALVLDNPLNTHRMLNTRLAI